MHNKKFTQKALSLICAAILVLTAVLVPAGVTVAAENAPASGSFSLDFSSADSTAPEFKAILTDAAGNPFTPIKSAVGKSGITNFYPTTELVTLEDGNGKSHNMLKITVPAMNSGNGGAINITLLDKDGHPFVIAPNTSYSINATYYIKTANANTLLTFGTGSIQHLYTRASADTPNMSGSSRIDMNVKAWEESTSIKDPIPWNFKDNIASFGYTVNGTTSFMFDPMYQIEPSKFLNNTNENWYDKKLTYQTKLSPRAITQQKETYIGKTLPILNFVT